MTAVDKIIANDLIEIGALSLSPNKPFTWASGIKSPIYCDNRMTLYYPELRKKIALGLTEIIKEKFSDVDIIAGTATAGIPHATLVSDIMNLPMVYVRSKPKDHGKGNQIEGKVEKGKKAVLIEDLISTGGSSVNCAKALEEAGIEVLGIAAIFTYELDLADNTYPVYTLSNYSALIDVCLNKSIITEDDLDKLKKWRSNPKDESWMKK